MAWVLPSSFFVQYTADVTGEARIECEHFGLAVRLLLLLLLRLPQALLLLPQQARLLPLLLPLVFLVLFPLLHSPLLHPPLLLPPPLPLPPPLLLPLPPPLLLPLTPLLTLPAWPPVCATQLQVALLSWSHKGSVNVAVYAPKQRDICSITLFCTSMRNIRPHLAENI